MMPRSGNDLVDAFMYSIEALKVDRARRQRRHRLVMLLLIFGAITIGSVIGWVMQ